MPTPICLAIPPASDPLRLTLPGGPSIEHMDLLQVVQPALTPLMPIFNIIDAVVAVFECIKAIPQTIGPPPDPTALATAIPDLAQKVGKLLGLIPQLSLPLTVVGLIDLILDTLRKTRDQLKHLQERLESISTTSARALELDDPGLLDIALCAEANVAQEAANLGKALGSIGQLIALMNIFLGMIGGPEIPDLAELSGKPLDQVLDPLDAIVGVLEDARAVVPVP
jgi:hypothetical protein